MLFRSQCEVPASICALGTCKLNEEGGVCADDGDCGVPFIYCVEGGCYDGTPDDPCFQNNQCDSFMCNPMTMTCT